MTCRFQAKHLNLTLRLTVFGVLFLLCVCFEHCWLVSQHRSDTKLSSHLPSAYTMTVIWCVDIFLIIFKDLTITILECVHWWPNKCDSVQGSDKHLQSEAHNVVCYRPTGMSSNLWDVLSDHHIVLGGSLSVIYPRCDLAHIPRFRHLYKISMCQSYLVSSCYLVLLALW